MKKPIRVLFCSALVLVFAACPRPPEPPGPPGPAIITGAGDIASCSWAGDEATAALLDEIPGVVFTAGDNVYPLGTLERFTECYDPSWGRHKGRTRPSLGNHDYLLFIALPYFLYFGENAGELGKGYYSYDLGEWHIVVIDSNFGTSAGSPQLRWLRSDLATNRRPCTLAYWHHPRFSSGRHGNHPKMEPVWEALYEAGADVVISGHDHTYERFARQAPDGTADPDRGIRQFVVGTGGAPLYEFRELAANSEVRENQTHGVLTLTLHPTSYEWEFIPVAGKEFRDSGSEACH